VIERNQGTDVSIVNIYIYIAGALPVINTTNTVDEDEITKNIRALKLQGSPRAVGKGRKAVKSNKSTPASSPSIKDDSTQKKKKSQKQARVWDGQIAKGEMEALDYSANKGNDEEEEDDVDAIAAQFVDESKLGQKNEKGIYTVQDVIQQESEQEELDFGDEDQDLKDKTQKAASAGLFSYFKSFTSQREMTAETLDPVIATIKEHLITQNVATEIAEHLCQSVRTSLLGKKLGSFERISTAVRNSMETALKRILTPKTSLDILRDIEQAKSEKRPYTMCFIGVNGVGKVRTV
jgi:signal recognition particle receptor subunit alpha